LAVQNSSVLRGRFFGKRWDFRPVAKGERAKRFGLTLTEAAWLTTINHRNSAANCERIARRSSRVGGQEICAQLARSIPD
jgi:hypothetical protein